MDLLDYKDQVVDGLVLKPLLAARSSMVPTQNWQPYGDFVDESKKHAQM